MTETHCKNPLQNVTSIPACWHLLSVQFFPCDVMWGHLSAVPDNDTEMSTLNYNGLSFSPKYLSACSHISNFALQDLLDRYSLHCTVGLGEKLLLLLSVPCNLAYGIEVYLSDTKPSESIQNIISGSNWLKFSYYMPRYSVRRWLTRDLKRPLKVYPG